VLDTNNTSSTQNLNFNTAGIFGLGVGYKVNNWFRADVTGEYRGNSQFFGTDRITYPGGVGTDTYTRPRTSGSFSPTPMSISAPGGASLRSSAPASAARGWDQRLHRSGHCQQRRRRTAGSGLRRQRVEVEPGLGGSCRSRLQGHAELHRRLAYRYLDMGDGLTGDLRTFDGTNNINNPMTFKNITSHDLKLGVRWNLESPQVYAPPLMRKG